MLKSGLCYYNIMSVIRLKKASWCIEMQIILKMELDSL